MGKTVRLSAVEKKAEERFGKIVKKLVAKVAQLEGRIQKLERADTVVEIEEEAIDK